MSSPLPGAPPIAFAPPVPLEVLAQAASVLEPVPPHERRGVLRGEAASLLDSLLARVARSRGALDVAMAEALADLAAGDRLLRRGYSGAGDYARQVLGVEVRTAQALVRLGRGLATRPLLREALRSGEVSMRRAQAVLPLAAGAEEAAWVQRARGETVRALEAAVKEARRAAACSAGAPADASSAAVSTVSDYTGCRVDPLGGDEEWERISMPVSDACRAKLDQAMALAGRLLGAASPQWQRLEALCQEYLGAHPAEAGEPEPASGSQSEADAPGAWAPASSELGAPVGHPGARLSALKAWLEEESERWRFLEVLAPVAAPRLASVGCSRDPAEVDAELRGLAALRDRWDELLGHLAMLVRSLGLWRDLRFASFDHYCEERLGMGGRTVEQRVWLERRLYELPALRAAMREGRVSYEKARVVAGCADAGSVEAWIDRAASTTCVALRREAEALDQAQMRARGAVSFTVPCRVALLLSAAFRAARAGAACWLGPGECLERVAEHFVVTWSGEEPARSTPQRRAIERDGGLCQVPGCTRAAVHAHHVLYRSRGGGDEPENLVALCAAHHLHGVHRGWVRVRGRAPAGLSWELGGAAALA